MNKTNYTHDQIYTFLKAVNLELGRIEKYAEQIQSELSAKVETIGQLVKAAEIDESKIQQLEKVLQEMQDYGCHIRDEDGYVCSVVKDKERLETELAEARQMIEQLRPFLRHSAECQCAVYEGTCIGGVVECDCGLERALSGGTENAMEKELKVYAGVCPKCGSQEFEVLNCSQDEMTRICDECGYKIKTVIVEYLKEEAPKATP